jgi:hypothetical protein
MYLHDQREVGFPVLTLQRAVNRNPHHAVVLDGLDLEKVAGHVVKRRQPNQSRRLAVFWVAEALFGQKAHEK